MADRVVPRVGRVGSRRAENTIWEGSKHFPEKVKSQMRSDGVIEIRWVRQHPPGGWYCGGCG